MLKLYGFVSRSNGICDYWKFLDNPLVRGLILQCYMQSLVVDHLYLQSLQHNIHNDPCCVPNPTLLQPCLLVVLSMSSSSTALTVLAHVVLLLCQCGPNSIIIIGHRVPPCPIWYAEDHTEIPPVLHNMWPGLRKQGISAHIFCIVFQISIYCYFILTDTI